MLNTHWSSNATPDGPSELNFDSAVRPSIARTHTGAKVPGAGNQNQARDRRTETDTTSAAFRETGGPLYEWHAVGKRTSSPVCVAGRKFPPVKA